MLEAANPNELTAAGLLALAAKIPEIDGDAFMRGVGAEADKPQHGGADDDSDNDDSDGEGDGGAFTF